MAERRRGLGRGLGALIPSSPDADRPVDVFFPGGTNKQNASRSTDAVTTAEVTPGELDNLVPVPGAKFAHIPVDDIRPNPRQPRIVFEPEELAELVGSIREIGVLQPVVVRPVDNRFELIMGERRLRASREAGLTHIPAIVRETEDSDLLRDALLENLHRAALNPLEEAAAYQQLLDDFDCTHDELASRISRSRPQISNTLRLLKLPAGVQKRVAEGELSAGHARALLRIADPIAIEQAAGRVVSEGLSVRATEQLAAEPGTAPATGGSSRYGNRVDALTDLGERLSERFGVRARISLGKRNGKLSLEFGSIADLNRLIDEIAPGDPGVFRKK